MDNIRQKLKNLPEDSGVYVMLDKDGAVIYIGKARVLKNRVRQYFNSSTGFNEKTAAMVSRVHDFHYYITPTEADALALEANLVKKHKPPYNILLKDDKHFPYIRVDLREEFPKFALTRKVKKDGAKYFGPYMGGVRVRELLDIISSAYGMRQCGLNFKKIPKNHRPCLNYEIGKCSAPCAGLITPEQYQKNALRAADFLSGKNTHIKALLTKKMFAASEREQYETAALYRDRLAMVEKLGQSRIAALSRSLDADIFGYHFDGRYGAVSMLVVREGNMEGIQNFSVSDAGLSPEDTFMSFITQYYGGAVNAPQEVICPPYVSDNALGEYLSQLYMRKVTATIPQKGIKKRLADMAQTNATEYVEKYLERIKHREDITLGAVWVLQKQLSLPRPPLRIECYDVSHLSGEQKAASMAVLINGQTQPSLYRRFKVKVPGNDDFASIEEVLRRRFDRLARLNEQSEDGGDLSFSALPDLVVIDGGKGQLSRAHTVLGQMGFEGKLSLIALAERDEEIFLPNSQLPILLDKSSLGLRLLQRVRDEAHRFGLGYHRKLRDKRFTSELDNIPGIGRERKKLLLKHFKSIEGIKKAGMEELSALPGISHVIAKRIYDYFAHPESKNA